MAQPAKKAPALVMPMATAVWLIDNTKITFKQIAEFVGLTELEIEALANGDIGKGIVGRNPVENFELTLDEIMKAESKTTYNMKKSRSELPRVQARSKGPRYTPVSKRADKPDAIAFILKNFPDIKDSQICRLIGTTKPTIAAVRDKTHINSGSLRPRHPVEIGLCTYAEFDTVSKKALKAAGKDPDQAKPAPAKEEKTGGGDMFSPGFDFSNFLGGSKPPTPKLEDEQ
jgi:hypothetical protein